MPDPKPPPQYVIKTHEHFLTSTDPSLLDVAEVHAYISERSYWGRGIPYSIMQRALENSLVVGLYDTSMDRGDGRWKQVGFGRWVTDQATFAYLSDVFVVEEYQGRGLGKWLVECLMSLPQLETLRRLLLITGGAEQLYQKYAGFRIVTPGTGVYTYMEIVRSTEELYGSIAKEEVRVEVHMGMESGDGKTLMERLEEGRLLAN
ncbi:hypothetical protein FN846DRAFT_914556 [Sphaerosporella brunnea]|uniref:N-acetyltransferase domain-containing protein n=1 Tax=Sphaerosporella brunnea TaxID=1250544 RepID=A0A5J5EBX3_9PEZI|nr:hypothetical protein FN846DRAFT_914556 [Sphaerosporella brunnea]